MVKAIFDTNILIDYLNGLALARAELEQFDIRCISIITYIEILVGIDDDKLRPEIEGFLSSFQCVEVNQEIAHYAIAARKKYKLKVPDAIILATAQATGAMLVTRNTKDFPSTIPIVRIPYEITQSK